MKPKIAVQLVEFHLEKFPQLSDWRVTITTRARRLLGLCNYDKQQLILSEFFVLNNEPPAVEELGKHEIAHALVGPDVQSHGEEWKAQARALGIQPRRCHEDVIVPLGRWIAVCPSCAKVFSRYRKFDPARRCWCKTCGRVKGVLTFHENVDKVYHPGNGE